MAKETNPSLPKVPRVSKPLYIEIYKAAISGLVSSPTYNDTPDDAIVLQAHSIAAKSVHFINNMN